ncbi:MAG: tetratricopeptide repeat protein [Bryobacteraceae bacterium]
MRSLWLAIGLASVLSGHQPTTSNPEAGLNADHQAALQRYAAKDYKAAAESFQKAMNSEAVESPAYRQSTLLLGQSLYLMGRYEEAIAVLKRAPRTGETLYMLGNSALKSRDLKSSTAYFAEMFGVPPGSASAHVLTAQLMMRQELLDEAEAEARTALAIDPRIPQAHYLLGELLTFKGETDKAIEELRTEIQINPAFAMAYYKLGDAYSRQVQWAAAIPLLQKSVWLNPTYSGPYILLGKGYLQQKELSNAEGVLRRAIQLDPNNSSAHYLLGQTLVQEGRADEGRAMLQLSQKLKN